MVARGFGQHKHCLTWTGEQATQLAVILIDRQTLHGRLTPHKTAWPLKQIVYKHIVIVTLFTNIYIATADQTIWPFGQPSWSNALVSRVTVPKSNHGLANGPQSVLSAYLCGHVLLFQKFPNFSSTPHADQTICSAGLIKPFVKLPAQLTRSPYYCDYCPTRKCLRKVWLSKLRMPFALYSHPGWANHLPCCLLSGPVHQTPKLWLSKLRMADQIILSALT